jgi:hypothetical protein
MSKTKPYKKEVVNGIVTNPITKENPYLFSPNYFPKNRVWQTVRNKYFTGQTIINPFIKRNYE